MSNSPQASFPAGHQTPPSSKPLRTIFLDRDGVINRKMPEGQYVTSWQQFELLPGVPESIAKLNQAGLQVLVVSNQRGIALGLYTTADVDEIHRRLGMELISSDAHIDGFYFCPHDKNSCTCRKPLPGLFDQAQADFPDIESASSVMIGDSFSDIEFGHNLGMRAIFLQGDEQTRRHQKSGAQKAIDLADESFSTLPEAVAHLLQEQPQVFQR